MAEPLKARMRSCLTSAILPVMVAACPAHAEVLPDPTRPPAILSNPDGAVAYQGPVLQSIYVSPSRREAMIDGQSVRVGGKVGGATVVGIADDAVLLREGKDLRTLRLFPNLVEMPALSAASRKTGGKNHGHNAKN
jgi:MSHA biogenesis protein MshK